MTPTGPSRPVEQTLAAALAAWSAASLAAAAVLARHPGVPRSARGFARQTAAWGAVDGLVAAWGTAARRRRGPTEPARLRRVLQVNLALDAGYVVSGLAVLRSSRARSRGWHADGAAVVVQGLFLLLLDGWAERALREP